MKKSHFTLRVITILIALSGSLLSPVQNSSPYWSLAGNNNAGNNSKLGTTNAFPLRLFTNNLERMRIDATGRVGIGTAGPVNILTVK